MIRGRSSRLDSHPLIAGVVAWELESEGLRCSCTCPMCSVDACGCVFLGALTLTTAWSETATGDDAAEGFLLQTPRPGSPLALSGVQGEERLLAIDGQKVRVGDVQNAICKHQRGEGMEFLIQRGSDRPRKIAVNRVDQAT